MPVECKYCGNRESILAILWKRFTTGRFPECEECGADDDTLEVRSNR